MIARLMTEQISAGHLQQYVEVISENTSFVFAKFN